MLTKIRQILIGLILVTLGVLNFASSSFAATTDWSTDFDDFSTGNINAQFDWASSGTPWTIQDLGGGDHVARGVISSSDATYQPGVYLDTLYTSWKANITYTRSTSSDDWRWWWGDDLSPQSLLLEFQTANNGQVVLIGRDASTGSTITPTIATNLSGVAFDLNVEIQNSGTEFRFNINGGTWTNWVTFYSAYGSGTDRAYQWQFTRMGGGGTTNTLQINSFGDATPPDPFLDAVCQDLDNLSATYDATTIPLAHPLCASTISSITYPSATGTAEFRLYRGAEHVASWSSPLTGNCNAITSPVNDPWCATTFMEGYPWTSGSYSVEARVCFTGYSCSTWNTPEEFSYQVAGLGSGTIDTHISDLWGGGHATWSDFINDYPGLVETYPSCDFTDWDLSTFVTCFVDLNKYFLFPDADAFANILGTPLGILETRWPFTYVTGPIYAYQNGLVNGSGSCQMPELGGFTLGGITAPTFQLCDAFDATDAQAELVAQPIALQYILYAIYIGFALLWIQMVRSFFHN